MIRAHAIHPRSLGVSEIVQAVKTGLSAVKIRGILYKSDQSKVVPKEAKLAFFVESRLEACHFPSANLAMAREDVAAVENAQHLVSHCSLLVVQFSIYRVQITDRINEFTLCARSCRVTTEPRAKLRNGIIFSLVSIDAINFVNKVHQVLALTIAGEHLKNVSTET